MKQTLTDHPTATIYQYKHVKRILIRNELLVSYLLSALIVVAFQYLYYDMYGLFSTLIGFVALQVLHFLIMWLTFITVHQAADRKWKWTIIPRGQDSYQLTILASLYFAESITKCSGWELSL